MCFQENRLKKRMRIFGKPEYEHNNFVVLHIVLYMIMSMSTIVKVHIVEGVIQQTFIPK